jgi:hypothetical protein
VIMACHSAAAQLVRGNSPRTALLLILLGVGLCDPVAAQQAQPAPPVTQGAPPPPDQARDQGALGTVGGWIDQSIERLGSTLKSTQKTIDDLTAPTRDAVQHAAGAAKDAATAVTRLPGFVSGSERCLTAPNGAPDCRAATEALCKANGYQGGRSLDTRTEAYCPPPKVKLSGTLPKIEECVYVTRAICR